MLCLRDSVVRESSNLISQISQNSGNNVKYFPGTENNKQSDTVTGSIFDLKTKINEKNMNIITDKAKLQYRANNNSG